MLTALPTIGGGTLRDVIVGGLVLVGLLWLANVVGHSFLYIIGSICVTLALVFIFRIVIVRKGLQSPVLGT